MQQKNNKNKESLKTSDSVKGGEKMCENKCEGEKTYYFHAIVTNWDEWEERAKELLKNRGSKTDDEILEEIVKFDYKLDFISDEPPFSLTESQNS